MIINNTYMLDLLIEAGASIDQRDGSDINLPSKNGDHPVIIAENMGNEYVLNRLKEHKNFYGNDDHSSLVPEAMTAVASNIPQNAVKLIANHTTSIGNTSNICNG